MNRPRRPRGFTLIETLIVIVIVAILAGILLPVLNGAVRTAKNSAVLAEFQTLGAALEAFKAEHGQYPPSRAMLCEDGYWNLQDATPIPVPGGADVRHGDLAARSVEALRRFWHRVPISTSGPQFDGSATWYDFNGNGKFDRPAVPGRGVILDGAECLVFFLGGIPLDTGTTGDPERSLSGFARGNVIMGGRPTPHPFRNARAAGGPASAEDRGKVGYEFKVNRLIDADADGFPEYADSLGTDRPIAYFAALNNGYDPNDCNWPEPKADGTPGDAVRKFRVPFVVVGGIALGNTNRQAVSPAPNPYTSSLAVTPATVGTSAWHRQASYQLLSAGRDGLFGLGGAYMEGKTPALPLEVAPVDDLPVTNDGGGGRAGDGK